ncbi:MAG: hypothetical protein ACREUG_09065 [Steroidobacteraceae bacterium]
MSTRALVQMSARPATHRARERRFTRVMLLAIAVLFALCGWGIAHAAKVTVIVTTATTNTDRTTVSSISRVRLTWGPCIAGAKSGDPASDQTSVQAQSSIATTGASAVPGAQVTVAAFPVNLNPVCFVAFNSDAAGTESGPTNVLVYSPPSALGKPTQLGQPVQLP